MMLGFQISQESYRLMSGSLAVDWGEVAAYGRGDCA